MEFELGYKGNDGGEADEGGHNQLAGTGCGFEDDGH